MVNDLTVKYYTKHRYGAGNEKIHIVRLNRNLLRTINQMQH